MRNLTGLSGSVYQLTSMMSIIDRTKRIPDSEVNGTLVNNDD